jgi:hypothetical protein
VSEVNLIEVSRDLAAETMIPKADIHLHAETNPRLDRLLARRRGEVPYDWQAWMQSLRSLPPGLPRLQAMSVQITNEDEDKLAENFR